MKTDLTAQAVSLTSFLSGRLGDALALLEAFVNLDTSSRAVPALAEAGRWIEPHLAGLGFDVERHDSAAHGPVLIGRASGGGRHRVLLLGHYDTVFEPGEPGRRPFRADGQRAYGPGVADMKGGLVTMWEALRALRHLGWADYRTLTIIHNGDEEIGSDAARPFIEAEARSADFCLVFEPGRPDGSIVTARKGVGRFTLTVRGKAAHAGVAPQDGASAVVALAHKILALHALNDYASGLTVNTIVTGGGTRANVVPDEAVARIDLRFPTEASGTAAVARMRAVARADDLPGTTGDLSGEVDRPPMEPGPNADVLLGIAREAATALGFALRNTKTGGGSDGNLVAPFGIPVLDGLGAVGGGFHSAGEYLEIDTLTQRAALAALVLMGACRQDALRRAT
jgi:glutamate carboxypeptidase